MRVRFYIEKRRAEDGSLLTARRPIFMTVAFHGKRVSISTGKNVDLFWWDPKKQQVKETHPEAKAINGWLNTLANTASLVWKGLASLSEKPGVREFRETFEELRPRFSGGFFDVMFLFIEEGSERWSNSTYKKVRTFYNQLKSFEKDFEYELSFSTIDEVFFSKYTTYLRKGGKSEMTILKSLNTLVWFLNWATKQGYNVYRDYRTFYKMLKIEGVQKKKLPIYLEWEELIQLMNYDTKLARVERVRDLFCIMCFTGLRFPELQNLKKGDITESLVLVKKANSKGRQLPLNRYASNLFQKYQQKYYRDNSALPPLSPITMNKYLKIIAEKLGFDRLVQDPKDDNSKIALNKALSAGVATQTFIMNALRLDIPLEVIATYTGINNDQRVKILKREIEKKEIKKFDNLLPQ